ncbi:MBL fold metallo-hydrolase [Gryllotalpicola reticulitermitis]|uniref:MBL fold metallo-hydrolase n=1 Tax=Gryllotalpicola reticulitermitis TaxID=1184153 RepID=A0ABV8Q7H0_9MICO
MTDARATARTNTARTNTARANTARANPAHKNAAHTTIEFFGGLGVIGSSKIEISHGGGESGRVRARVQLDMGLEIPNGDDLMAAPVGLGSRPGRELADLLRIGAAPRIPGLYDPRWLRAGVAADGAADLPADFTADVADDLSADLPADLPADPATDLATDIATDAATAELLEPAAGPHALFISHAHLDHMGLAGFVRPSVPIYATAQTVALLRALHASGDGVLGAEPDWRVIEFGELVSVGEITVQALPVDHDVPGACGFLVTTPDGRVAFTGDLRFHGDEDYLSHDFAERVAGVDVLVTEGTSLSWEPLGDRPAGEHDIVERFRATLETQRGLVLLALYPRNAARALQFRYAASRAGRTLVWSGQIAALFARLGWSDVVTWDESRPQASAHLKAIAAARADGFQLTTVSLNDVHAQPDRFVVMPDPHDLPSLLDLPIVPGDVLLHSNGQPLGEFDAWWRPFTAWLDRLGVELRFLGSSGHASADDLHAMIERIAPRVVFPIHTFSPRRLQVPTGVRRVIAEYGVRYSLDGDAQDPDSALGTADALGAADAGRRG